MNTCGKCIPKVQLWWGRRKEDCFPPVESGKISQRTWDFSRLWRQLDFDKWKWSTKIIFIKNMFWAKIWRLKGARRMVSCLCGVGQVSWQDKKILYLAEYGLHLIFNKCLALCTSGEKQMINNHHQKIIKAF